MPTLSFTHGDLSGKRFSLDQERITVGRSKQNILQIQDDSVSSEHCVFLVHDSEVLVCECDSSNGTYVDDIRVAKQQPVKSGQTIRFGRVTARLDIEFDEEASSGDEITAVRGFQRAMKRAQQPPAPSVPSGPLFDAELGEDNDAPTVILRPPTPPKPQLASSIPARSPEPTGSGRRFPWGWLAVVVVVFALIAWGVFRSVR